MKRTNFVTRLVGILLFVAMALYLGVYLVRCLSNDLRTAPAVYVEMNDAASMSGVIVRDEEYVESSEQYLSVNAENGKALAKGDTIAVAYSSDEALQRAGQIRELELKAEYISSVLSGSSGSDSATQKESSINYAVEKLSAAAARHETDDIPTAALNVSAVVFENSSGVTQDDLSSIQDQITSLKQTSARDTNSITASESGLFATSTDGYEYLSEKDLSTLTPSGIDSLKDKAEAVPTDSIGKMVYSNAWYYAASMSVSDADKLKLNDWVSLDFGRYCSNPIKGCIISKSEAEGDKCVVVFRCTSYMSDMLAVRFADADIIFNTTSGLRVPKKACYTDDGGTYVYISTGIQAEKIYINVLQDMDDYYLVEKSGDDKALKENNDIIITSHKIYDGMLLN